MRGWARTSHRLTSPTRAAALRRATREAPALSTREGGCARLSVFRQGTPSAENPPHGFSASRSETLTEKGRQKKNIGVPSCLGFLNGVTSLPGL